MTGSVPREFIKRGFDICFATLLMICTAPLLVFAAIGVSVTSTGPIFYKARRAGKGGTPFAMYKFRTMTVGADNQSAVTAPGDHRVFPFGSLLRQTKIDELPQLWNVIAGDMSFVGPRPEDPKIVERDYTPWMLETLNVRPGLTSPGAVYGYIFGEQLLESQDPEGSYARNLLPPKLALERAYMERADLVGDIHYIALTVSAVLAHISGRRVSLPSRDIEAAKFWAPQGPYPAANFKT